jgi:type IV secretory pathway TrbF-like protein
MSSSSPHPNIPPAAHLSLNAVLRLPPAASAQARAEAYAVRAYVIAVLVALAMLIQAVGWVVLLPLKRIDAVLVERSGDGAVVTTATRTARYEPSQNDIKFFLGQITTHIWSIDRLTTERDILTTRKHFIRDKADAELAEFIGNETPIARLRRDPGLTRKVKVHGVSIFKDGASVDFSTEERASGAAEAAITRRLATYHFTLVPPSAADEDLILVNPAGLYVTHFEFNRKL